MFKNELFCDVKFVARVVNGGKAGVRVIPAHKFMMSISSPVFEAMFYGELAENCLTVSTTVCWSCFATSTATK